MLTAVFAMLIPGFSAQDARDLLRPMHVGSEAELDVVLGADGRAITILGRFPMQPSSGSGSRVVAFADAQQSLLGLSGTPNEGQLILKSEVLDRELIIAHFDQSLAGLRIWDAEVTATFFLNGQLHSLNGQLLLDRSRSVAAAPFAVEDVLAIIQRDLGILESGSTFVADSRNDLARATRSDGAWIERGYDATADAVIWRAWLPAGDVRVDEETGTVISWFSHERQGYDDVTTGCTVRHPDFPRDVNGRASSLDTQSGFESQIITCGGDSWFGQCYWQMKLQNGGISHPLARVDDANGGEQEIVQPCVSSAPMFTDTGGDYQREQTAYWSLERSRAFMVQNVFSQVAPDRTSNVDAHHDNDAATDCAKFDGWWVAINLSTSCSGRASYWMHEYGHYVVWAYNELSAVCEAGDQGGAINETLANCFAMITMVDETQVTPDYGAVADLVSSDVQPHRTGQTPSSGFSCTSELHSVGRAFEQAVWELLYNRNCSTSSTCSDTTAFGNDIWIGEGQEAVITHVGAALGAALKNLGENVTFAQVRAQFVSRVLADSGTAVRDRVQLGLITTASRRSGTPRETCNSR